MTKYGDLVEVDPFSPQVAGPYNSISHLNHSTPHDIQIIKLYITVNDTYRQFLHLPVSNLAWTEHCAYYPMEATWFP